MKLQFILQKTLLLNKEVGTTTVNGKEVQEYDQYEIPSEDHTGWNLTEQPIKFDEHGKLFVGAFEITTVPTRKQTRPMSQDEQNFAEKYVIPYGGFLIGAASLVVAIIAL